jgi:hypothetical protein
MNSKSNQESAAAAPTSVQLDGFAPAAGSGASSSAVASSAGVAIASSSVSAAAGSGGGGAGLQSIASVTAAATTTTATTSSAIAATQTKRAKKRGPSQQQQQGHGQGGMAASTSTSTAAGRSAENYDFSEETALRPLSDIGSNFEPLTLPQIQLRLKNLLEQLPKDLPKVPPDDMNSSSNDAASPYTTIKLFASTLQVTIEEYNLLISLVSSATYKWGVDRSGASQQNLAVMSAELQQCQDVISNVVSARLSNVLCPAVDVLIGEVEVVKVGGVAENMKNGGDGSGSCGDGREVTMEDVSGSSAAKRIKLNDDRLNDSKPQSNERRINHYTRPLVDPSYVHLCHCILARNAPLIRHAVATSIHTAHRVIGDYMNAMKKDTSHDAGKGGYY